MLASVLGSLLALASIGCSSNSSSRATAGPIAILTSSGAPAKTSVAAIASRLNLSMTPTGDKLNAGVDWTVTCGGNPVSGSLTNGACGTFTPAHTADGAATLYTAPSVIPIDNTITITATVTSDPSQSSSTQLTIIAAPIAVLFYDAAGPLPTSLDVNSVLNLSDTTTNDPLGAGVVFSATCGSSACGSFNPTQAPTSTGSTVYTAPSVVPQGGTVTITATSLTDTTKSSSATLNITTPVVPPGITVAVAPTALYAETVGPAHRVNVTAVVLNDAAAAGVDWSVTCSGADCGGITAHTASGTPATFTAPSTVPTGGTVTITAKSTTNPAASAAVMANIVTSAPIVVSQSSPLPATISTGSQAMLAATVTGDPNNLGVDWSATCAGNSCGSFNLSPAHTASGGQITYTAPTSVPPGGGFVTIVATATAASSTTPANPDAEVTTIVATPPSVSFTQSPPASLAATTQAPVSASVANDVAPGGVTWSVQCSNTVPGGCGYVSPSQTASGATATYTAPPVPVPSGVTITATSVANSSASAASNAVTINPDTTLSVSFIPSLPAQIPAGSAPVNLTAAVANDATAAGIDWQVCASGCGFFTVKPAIAANPAEGILPIAAVTATSVSGWSNGLPIPYTPPAQPPPFGSVTIVAAAHADNTKANSGTIAINTLTTGPPLNGSVRSGMQMVTGSTVSLFAAGSSGYASASLQLASATTDKNGNFTIAGGYVCPSPASQTYLVAAGGGVGTNAANPNLALMTAVGNCGNLASTPVIVNEVTTVASVTATAPFAANDALSGNSSALYLGADSSNQAGLANAFSAVNSLVDISTGIARYTNPAGNAAVPYVEINTLANALNACTATSGGVEGDGSPCGTLFSAADVLPAATQIPNVIAPSDTLQAAFNIAQHPVVNYGYTLNSAALFGLATTASPFQPILTTQPNDWSMSLNYVSGGGLSSTSTVGSFAVDAAGNLWITDTTAGSVIEWNPVGAAVSPSTGFAAGGGPIAIDANGNVWTSSDGKLNELNSLGSPAPGSPFKGIPGGGSELAIDAQGNLWIANGAAVNEFSNLGLPVSPNVGFVNNGVSGITGVGIDSSDNVWLGNGTENNFAELTNPGGDLIVLSTQGGGGSFFPQLASNASGDVWAASSANTVCEVTPYAGQGSLLIPSCTSFTAADFYQPEGLAFDGAGTLWIASAGGGSSPVIQPSIFPLAPSLIANNTPNYLASPSLAAGTLRVAVDASGNTWVLLANNTVTEYIGNAVPVVTPIALGVTDKKLAAKP